MIQATVEIADTAEKVVSELLTTPMFPTRRYGVAHGDDSSWSKEPLPNNSQCPYQLSTPKPDGSLGYLPCRKSDVLPNEKPGLNYSMASRYTQAGVRSFSHS